MFIKYIRKSFIDQRKSNKTRLPKSETFSNFISNTWTGAGELMHLGLGDIKRPSQLQWPLQRREEIITFLQRHWSGSTAPPTGRQDGWSATLLQVWGWNKVKPLLLWALTGLQHMNTGKASKTIWFKTSSFDASFRDVLHFLHTNLVSSIIYCAWPHIQITSTIFKTFVRDFSSSWWDSHLYRNLRASLSDSRSVSTSPSLTGPFTFLMMERLLSSMNSTRTYRSDTTSVTQTNPLC